MPKNLKLYNSRISNIIRIRQLQTGKMKMAKFQVKKTTKQGIVYYTIFVPKYLTPDR